MRLNAFPQWDKLTSLLRGMARQSAADYAQRKIVRIIPKNGIAHLANYAVNRLVVPPEAKGTARDFFVRLVITADEIPEVAFAPPVAGPAGALAGGGYSPAGETISFEDVDDDVFKCETGVNVFAFTELDNGIFIVNRKMVDIDLEVEFDPCGGTLDKTKFTFKLGAQYSALPKLTLAGYSFLGWFTEAEGGVKVEATDRCKTGVTKLYAHWAEYIDPFVDAICAARNLTFFSDAQERVPPAKTS